MPKRRSYDRWLLLTATLLAFAGLFMVGSASHYIAMSLGKDPTYFLVRHGAFLALGLATMAGAMALPLYRLDERRVVGGLSAASLAAPARRARDAGSRGRAPLVPAGTLGVPAVGAREDRDRPLSSRTCCPDGPWTRSTTCGSTLGPVAAL